MPSYHEFKSIFPELTAELEISLKGLGQAARERLRRDRDGSKSIAIKSLDSRRMYLIHDAFNESAKREYFDRSLNTRGLYIYSILIDDQGSPCETRPGIQLPRQNVDSIIYRAFSRYELKDVKEMKNDISEGEEITPEEYKEKSDIAFNTMVTRSRDN